MVTDLRRLRYMVCLATTLHYARAAEELGITQSALSKAIQALEQDMGLRLFDRSQSGVSMTDAGQRIADKAQALLASANDFEHLVKQTSKRQEGRIRFGMTPVIMQCLAPATIPSKLKSAPLFVHEILAREAETLWQMLVAREIEFFVSPVWDVPDVLPVRVDYLGDFPSGLAVRAGHPILEHPDSTDRFPILISAYGAQRGQLPLPLRYALPGAVHLMEDSTTLSRITQGSDAIWMTCPYAIVPEIEQGDLVVLPWPDAQHAPVFQVAIYSLERRSLSPTAIALRQDFQNLVAKLGQQSLTG